MRSTSWSGTTKLPGTTWRCSDPEAVLCREAGLRYAAIALITDFDAGLEGSDIPAVTQEEVFAFFEANVHTVRQVLFRALAADLPAGRIAAGPGFEPA